MWPPITQNLFYSLCSYRKRLFINACSQEMPILVSISVLMTVVLLFVHCYSNTNCVMDKKNLSLFQDNAIGLG